jgi:hypothetical protein
MNFGGEGSLQRVAEKRGGPFGRNIKSPPTTIGGGYRLDAS